MKKISLFGAVSTGVGMLIATSCFVSSASGSSAVGTPFVIAIVIACIANMLAVLSIAELNAIMPNLTGGIAQYTLAGLGPLLTIVTMVGGYLISNVFAAPAEGAMFANVMTEMTGEAIPPAVFSVGITIVLIFINLKGVNMSTLLQEIVAAFMVVSLLALGIIGALGLGSGEQVAQDAVISSDLKDILPLTSTAFWFFIGAEFIVPLGKDMKSPKKVPLSMVLSLGIMGIIQILLVFGFKNYTLWSDLGSAASPHVLYAVNMLGKWGRYWMIIVAIFAAVSTQNSIICSVSEICCGMAKMNLLPAFFQKKNKNGAPYWVIIILGVLTCIIEASGIGIACIAAQHFGVPVVFAKKSKSVNLEGEMYVAEVESFTHKCKNQVIVAKKFLNENDRVLIIDDFLANGCALQGLIQIVKSAGATVEGIGIAVEKGFQAGGRIIRNLGFQLESLAIVDDMDSKTGMIKFREEQ